jgi:MFS family permease
MLLLQTQTTFFLGAISCVIFAIYWAVVPGGVVGYAGAIYGRATLGKIWGLATLIVMGVGPFIGPLIGGYLKDSTGSYTYSIMFALASFVVSALLAASLPMTAEGKVSSMDDTPEAEAAAN